MLELIVRETGDQSPVWAKGPRGSFTSTAYAYDGTLVKVIALLESALEQAKFELSGLQNVHAIADVSATSAKVERNIPIPVVGNDDACGQSLVMATIGVESAPTSVGRKVHVIHDVNIALVGAVHNDNVAFI